jgi:Zn finger protein HypA/HybF involved in hydrogenase expression
MEGKFQNKEGRWLCESSASRCPAVKEKNSAGVKKAHIEGKMKSVFSAEERRKANESLEKKLATLPFEQQSWERQRNTVILEQENKCLHCANSEWMGKPLKLQVDHIDGNNRNNVRENLRALCPNCHSNTDTFCGKNINKGSKKVSDVAIIEEIKKGLTNRQVLVNVGLTPKGGNYERVNKLRLKTE